MTSPLQFFARSLLISAAAAASALAGDTVFENAAIYTMHAEAPRAQAIAVRDGRILAVGTIDAVRQAAEPGSTRVDLGGMTVTPGLIDAHGHIMGLGAFGLGRLDLSGVRSFEALVAAVRERVREAKPGAWLLGGRWDHESWDEKVLPRHGRLSDATPDHPVWLRRVDGHAGLANARALALAGITKETKDPPGGEIVRDAEGNPTGVLVDNAMDLMDPVLPRDEASAEDLILKAQEMCLSAGLTGVHDMGASPAEVEVYKSLAASGKLKMRVYVLLSSFYAVRWFEENQPIVGERLTVRGVKLYADGAMGSRGAWLLEPYADRPADDQGKPYTGLAVSEPSFIEDIARHAIEKGYQVCTHAIGDRANREVLDAYERAFKSGAEPAASYRFRVEHAQLLHPADIPRFAAMGVIPSMQPTHCTSDMRWVADRVGDERARGAYAWASLLATGARVAGGSDFPVESHNPMLGLAAAVTRQNEQGEPAGGWQPQERMTREQALRAFTQDAAYGSFEEEDKGALKPGMLADFIVLDRDILTCPPGEIARAKVLRTVVGGETVYQAR